MSSNTIRYEVIYKNLVRDIRKYFSSDFNRKTEYIRSKRNETEEFFNESLKLYIEKAFGTSYLALRISEESLMFVLGSLIYPKEMLKSAQEGKHSVAKVMNIYNYLYKFSLERLTSMLKEKELMYIIAAYLHVN